MTKPWIKDKPIKRPINEIETPDGLIIIEFGHEGAD